MSDDNKALNALLDGISLMIDEKLKLAGFDRSVVGFITGANLENNTYTVKINGYEYQNVKSVIGDLGTTMPCICTIPQNQMSQMYISGIIDSTNYIEGGGGGTGGDYNELNNKPSINGVTLIGNKTASDLGISQPTRTSQLTNDSNFVVDANYVHTDNNFTNALLSKLNGIEDNAEVNLIEKITVNGVEQAISNKTVALTVMTNTVNDLVNYYTKTNTYNKTEVNALISAIPKFAIEVVNTLPTTDISTTTIYLLRNSETTGSNLFEEYIYVNNQWELLGSQDIDLSDYVTTEDLNTTLASYVTSTNLSTILQGYVTTTMWNTLGAVATSNDYDDLDNKPTIPSYTAITANEISAGTDTTLKVVRADYLKAGIEAIVGALSAGHTIWNKIKTALTQRPVLWFKDAKVTDDSTNNSTNIEIIESVTKSQWDNLATTADGLYNIDDGTALPLTADLIAYDNTSSGLTANQVQDAIDELAQGGGGGGHVIQNANGTDLTQRDTLQFKGGLKATDDSTNEKTVVDGSPTEITWAEYNAMTPEQQQALEHTLVTNVPSIDSSINTDILVKLWENSNTTVNFSAQTIALSSDDYDLLLWIYKQTTEDDRLISRISEKGSGTILDYALGYASGGAVSRSRRVTWVDNTHFSIGDGESAVGTTAGIEFNRGIIPVSVYGIKKTINLTFDAIALNVSTLASNCMLSDGVTSVEDAIDELNTDTIKIQKIEITSATRYTDIQPYIYASIEKGIVPYVKVGTWTLTQSGHTYAFSEIALPLVNGTFIVDGATPITSLSFCAPNADGSGFRNITIKDNSAPIYPNNVVATDVYFYYAT